MSITDNATRLAFSAATEGRFTLGRIQPGTNQSRVTDTHTGRTHFATLTGDTVTIGEALPSAVHHEPLTVTFDATHLGGVQVNGRTVGALALGSNGRWFPISLHQVSWAHPVQGADNLSTTGFATAQEAAEAKFGNCGDRRCVTCGNADPNEVD